LSMNGKDVGVTPFSGPILVGVYQAQLTLDGYVPWKELIKVDMDYNGQIDLRKYAAFTPQEIKKKGKKKWPWYVAGICLVGGGTAAAILLNDNKEETGILRITIPQNP